MRREYLGAICPETHQNGQQGRAWYPPRMVGHPGTEGAILGHSGASGGVAVIKDERE